MSPFVTQTGKSISVPVRVVRDVRVVRAGGRGEAAWERECGDVLLWLGLGETTCGVPASRSGAFPAGSGSVPGRFQHQIPGEFPLHLLQDGCLECQIKIINSYAMSKSKVWKHFEMNRDEKWLFAPNIIANSEGLELIFPGPD